MQKILIPYFQVNGRGSYPVGVSTIGELIEYNGDKYYIGTGSPEAETGPITYEQYITPLKIPVLNISVTGQLRIGLGDIYTCYERSVMNITADIELPNCVMTIMFVELGSNDEELNASARFDATITDGKLNLPFKLPLGNYKLSCSRINKGLDNVNQPFHLDFEDIEFNSIVDMTIP